MPVLYPLSPRCLGERETGKEEKGGQAATASERGSPWDGRARGSRLRAALGVQGVNGAARELGPSVRPVMDAQTRLTSSAGGTSPAAAAAGETRWRRGPRASGQGAQGRRRAVPLLLLLLRRVARSPPAPGASSPIPEAAKFPGLRASCVRGPPGGRGGGRVQHLDSGGSGTRAARRVELWAGAPPGPGKAGPSPQGHPRGSARGTFALSSNYLPGAHTGAPGSATHP